MKTDDTTKTEESVKTDDGAQSGVQDDVNSPKTGDTMGAMLLAVLLISASVMILVFRKKHPYED